MSHVDEGVLHSYLDGELTPVERARVDEHLAGCLACRTRRDEERQLIERASKLLSAALPPDRLAPPLSAIARPRPRSFWHVRLPLAWAATVILAIGLGWSLSQQLGTPEVKTMSGPMAVRESQAPPATTGRLEPRQTPKPIRKAARQDTMVADQLATNQAAVAEEKSGAGVAAPAPAAPSSRADVRLQAVTVEAAPAPLDSAAVHAILGREPLVIPGLPVLSITRSPRNAHAIVVQQRLDSGVIVLTESRLTMVSQYLDRDRVASSADTRAPAVAKAAPDSVPLRRFIDGVWVEIQGRVTADSLQRLLGTVK